MTTKAKTERIIWDSLSKMAELMLLVYRKVKRSWSYQHVSVVLIAKNKTVLISAAISSFLLYLWYTPFRSINYNGQPYPIAYLELRTSVRKMNSIAAPLRTI
jgi:hypothetical protein